MIRDAPPKHPDSAKWYWLEWDAVELQNATIQTATWTLPAGITKDLESINGRIAGIKLSGGTLGEDYDILLQIVTTTPETLHEKLRIRVLDTGH